jgi:uncharacterized protein (TIGR03083 family)
VDLPAAYEQGRVRIVELVLARDPSVWNRHVPACPAWTVQDLIAHLQHVADDYSAGHYVYRSLDFDQPDRTADPDRNDRNEEWADAGVAARRGQGMGELLAAWEVSSASLYRMMTTDPALPDPHDNEMLAWAALGDFAIHYQDLHGALGVGPDRDAYCVKLGFATLPIMFAAHTRTVPGVHPLRFSTGRGEVVIGEPGDGDVPTIEVDWFELYRAMAGRRSRDQVAELLAPLDAELYLDAFTLYPFASTRLAV